MSPSPTGRLLREIREQPQVTARLLTEGMGEVAALARVLRRRQPPFVVFAARGSSDNAAVYGKYLVETLLGVPAALAAPSTVTLYRRSLRLRQALVVGLSQSGASPDVVEFVAAARRAGALAVAVTNRPRSPLADAAAHVLWLRAGAEHSVAATKTFLAQLLVLAMLVGAWGRVGTLRRGLARVPGAVEAALALDGPVAALARRWRDVTGCLVTGRGYGYAVALEAALKLKETCYLMAEALSGADLLHGPIALAAPGMPVLLVALRGPSLAAQRAVARRLAARGAEVTLVTDVRLRAGPPAATVLPLAQDLPEPLAAIPAAVPAQLLAWHLAVQRGIDPDRPRGLRKVTRTR